MIGSASCQKWLDLFSRSKTHYECVGHNLDNTMAYSELAYRILAM